MVEEFVDPSTGLKWDARLKVREEYRDEYGTVIRSGPYEDVPRVKTHMINPKKEQV